MLIIKTVVMTICVEASGSGRYLKRVLCIRHANTLDPRTLCSVLDAMYFSSLRSCFLTALFSVGLSYELTV